jgi:hypothetical protein
MEHKTPLTGLRNKGTVSSAPKGMDFVRAGIAMALGENSPRAAERIAQERWGASVASLFKAADVPGGPPTGMAPLVGTTGPAAEFFGVVNSRSILGRAGFRRVSHRSPILRGSAVNAAWVAEGQGKPIASVTYQRTLPIDLCKLVSLVVVTNELLRDSSVEAEAAIREEMVRAQVAAIDDTLVNPSNAGTTNDNNVVTEPASIFFGAPQGGSSPSGGEDDAFETLLGAFTGSLEDAVLMMEPKIAARLANANRPGIGARGGSWGGIPVITSSHMPGGMIGLVDVTGVAVVMDDNASGIRVSRQGSVTMENPALQSSIGDPQIADSPSLTAETVASSNVSLFQTNSVGILAERHVGWRVIRPGSAVYVSGIADFDV